MEMVVTLIVQPGQFGVVGRECPGQCGRLVVT